MTRSPALAVWRQAQNQALKIARQFAVDRDVFSCARMNKLKMRRVESHASDQTFGRFRRVILPVTDDRMADCRKLRPNLILQSGHQCNPDERGAGKHPFDGISKFCASRFGVVLGAQSLEHPYTSKIVNQRPFSCSETPAKNRYILPYRHMSEKLSNERFPIGLCFGEEQNAGRELIDAVDNHSALSLPRKSLGKQRQSGQTIGAFDRHSRQAGRFIEDYHGIILVKHAKIP